MYEYGKRKREKKKGATTEIKETKHKKPRTTIEPGNIQDAPPQGAENLQRTKKRSAQEAQSLPFYERRREKNKKRRQTKKRRKARQQLDKAIENAKQSKTGMTQEHTLTLIKFSIANDLISLWRPINEEAAAKLGQFYMGKALNTKAKSSIFGPVAGDIPVDARLSKLIVDEPEHIEHFQAKNKKALEEAEHLYSGLPKPLLPDSIDTMNELLLIKAIPKTDNLGRQIYFLTNNHNQIVWNKAHTSPKFIVEALDGSGFHYYKERKKHFSEQIKHLPEGYQKHTVEIMAYRQFRLGQGQQVEEIDRPITADYDELVSCSRKVFPYPHNQSITSSISLELWGTEELTADALWFNILLNYEEKVKKEHREVVSSQEQLSMGAVTDWQRAAKAYLKLETAGATNHGPEVNNPFPEKLKSGHYPYFLPNGDIGFLTTEENICTFINKWRKEGFPLDVNPRWGWDIDAGGDLFIPEIRFNWETVHENLRIEQAKLQSLEEEQAEMLKKLGLKNTEKNVKDLLLLKQLIENRNQMIDIGIEQYERLEQALFKDMQFNFAEPPIKIPSLEELEELVSLNQALIVQSSTYAEEMHIYHLKVTIEKLRLESDIIYTEESVYHPIFREAKENLAQKGEIPFSETEGVKARRKDMEQRVSQAERERRHEQIAKLQEELTEKQKGFSENYEGEISVIENAEHDLREAQIIDSQRKEGKGKEKEREEKPSAPRTAHLLHKFSPIHAQSSTPISPQTITPTPAIPSGDRLRKGKMGST